MQTFDFNRSYFRFSVDPRVQPAITVTRPMPTTSSNVRIGIECRCELRNRKTGASNVYVLGASCKTEVVGANRDVWMEPNADFCPIVSNDEFMVIKSWARRDMPVEKHPGALGSPLERQAGRCAEAWSAFSIELQKARGQALPTVNGIIEAIRGDRPIVARTQYEDGDWDVTIDHPAKTLNYSEVDDVYQTDTGPILLPDLSPERLSRVRRLVECFDLAYAAFNSIGWAEFIINVPTPVGGGLSVNHYSKTRRIEPVTNSLIEVIGESSLADRHVGADRGSRVDGAELPVGGNGTAKVLQRVGEKR
jgi:hypothetical protein